LRGFQQRLSEFDSRGIRVAVISSDSEEVTRRHARKMSFTFTCLADPRCEVIERYGVLHRAGGPKGASIARPAEFLVDKDGTIQWVNFTRSVAVRARPEQVLTAFDQLKSSGK
jgi:peroxiredoxin